MLLRVRITILVIIIILFVGVSFGTANWFTLEFSNMRFEQSTIQNRSELWQEIIHSQESAMANNVSALIRDRATRKALKKLDVKSLKENVSTTYNLLNASEIISRLQITDVNGKNLYSSFPLSNDDGGALALKSITVGKIVRGVERSSDGILYSVVAFPLSMRGKVIGAGVFSKDMTTAIERFKHINNADVFITNNNGNTDYLTDKDLYKALKSGISQVGPDSTSILEVPDYYYSVVNIPITNDAGNIVGNFITAKDFTESYNHQQSVYLMATIALILVVIMSLISIYTYMSFVLKPLNQAVDNLNEISEGNLSIEINVNSNDEIGSLQKAMSTTIEKLRDIVSQIFQMTEELTSTSGNISTSAKSTREGVHKEQDELSQLTTAITEMTATVQEVARNASVAAESTEKADVEARGGQQLVQQTVSSIQLLANEIDKATQAVDQVKDDSTSIGAILDVIKGIAEQTNLLALNAAIEAARAGEQGRGFAVVADEVRSLASRTQQSTQEIEAMIESLQSKVNSASLAMKSSKDKVTDSVALASKSGESLSVITSAATNISDMNIQIATAAEQQASVSEELNRNAVNINQISENSAEGVDVIFKETDTLANITHRLHDIVNKFKI